MSYSLIYFVVKWTEAGIQIRRAGFVLYLCCFHDNVYRVSNLIFHHLSLSKGSWKSLIYSW